MDIPRITPEELKAKLEAGEPVFTLIAGVARQDAVDHGALATGKPKTP